MSDDETHARLKVAVQKWWGKHGHAIKTDDPRWKPKFVLGQFLGDLGGTRVDHPKLKQWFSQIIFRTIRAQTQASSSSKKRRRAKKEKNTEGESTDGGGSESRAAEDGEVAPNDSATKGASAKRKQKSDDVDGEVDEALSTSKKVKSKLPKGSKKSKKSEKA